MGKRNRKRVAWLLSASLVMTSLGVLPGNLAAADAPEVTTISDAAGFMDAVEQMREPNEGRKGKYRLTDDIILTSENIVEPVETFEGEFNGDGHKIKGLRVVKDGKPAALFTTLQNKARITNVTFAEINREETVSVSVDAEGLLAKKIQGEAEVSDVTFSSSSFAISKAASRGSVAVSSVGLLAGELDGEAEISNVKIESSQIVVQGADSVSAAGLLAGKVQGQVKVKGVAAVTGSAVTVDGASREVGGILGSISGERIGQCENHATVTCVKGEMVGGIV
ncbi:MAG: hypothetical protein IJ733_13365, partial [Lachnospiraceae bacterium]|nr:hypothetical protein [Lachnospiraceae bacterium]